MGLASRSKRLLDTQMKLLIATLEPDTASGGLNGRFWQLAEAQQLSVEMASFGLLAARHGDLNVLDSENWHFSTLRDE
jgi:hypothetical protein